MSYVSKLRRALEPDRSSAQSPGIVISRPEGYLLRLDADQIDARRFERLAREGRTALAEHLPAGVSAEDLYDVLLLFELCLRPDVTSDR